MLFLQRLIPFPRPGTKPKGHLVPPFSQRLIQRGGTACGMMVREMAAVARQTSGSCCDFAFRLLDSLFEVSTRKRASPRFRNAFKLPTSIYMELSQRKKICGDHFFQRSQWQ
jgi:hypothetical protein